MSFSDHYKTNHVWPGPKHRKRLRTGDPRTPTRAPHSLSVGEPTRRLDGAARPRPYPWHAGSSSAPAVAPTPDTPLLRSTQAHSPWRSLGAGLLRECPASPVRRRVFE
ncbi:hypothetical protein LEMLEM_LOCUS7510 [Lemmus lemmus]